MTQTTDLNEPSSPEMIPAVLRKAAEKMREQAGGLESSWQDKQAGSPWLMIAKELERAAERIAYNL